MSNTNIVLMSSETPFKTVAIIPPVQACGRAMVESVPEFKESGFRDRRYRPFQKQSSNAVLESFQIPGYLQEERQP